MNLTMPTNSITLQYTCPECNETSEQALTSIVQNGTLTCDCGEDMELDNTVKVYLTGELLLTDEQIDQMVTNWINGNRGEVITEILRSANVAVLAATITRELCRSSGGDDADRFIRILRAESIAR